MANILSKAESLPLLEWPEDWTKLDEIIASCTGIGSAGTIEEAGCWESKLETGGWYVLEVFDEFSNISSSLPKGLVGWSEKMSTSKEERRSIDVGLSGGVGLIGGVLLANNDDGVEERCVNDVCGNGGGGGGGSGISGVCWIYWWKEFEVNEGLVAWFTFGRGIVGIELVKEFDWIDGTVEANGICACGFSAVVVGYWGCTPGNAGFIGCTGTDGTETGIDGFLAATGYW